MKLKAFSILELIVAIFLSGIVISAVYSGYAFTHQQFFKFTAIKTEIRNYFTLAGVLNREFESAKKVLKISSREIEIEMIDEKIHYSFNTEYIIRTLNEQTDTFSFKISDVTMDVFQVEDQYFVEYITLTLDDKGKEKPLTLYKSYGAVIQIEK